MRVTAPDAASASPDRAAEGPRFSAAVRQAGGAAGELLWQFPVPSHLTQARREELVEGWDALHNKRCDPEDCRGLLRPRAKQQQADTIRRGACDR